MVGAFGLFGPTSRPGHALPPACGNESTRRLRTCVPPPQLTEHADHCHADAHFSHCCSSAAAALALACGCARASARMRRSTACAAAWPCGAGTSVQSTGHDTEMARQTLVVDSAGQRFPPIVAFWITVREHGCGGSPQERMEAAVMVSHGVHLHPETRQSEGQAARLHCCTNTADSTSLPRCAQRHFCTAAVWYRASEGISCRQR